MEDQNLPMPHLTHLREVISPHLPPPVLALIHSFDSNPLINEYLLKQEDEPSMTIIITLLSIYAIYSVTKLAFSVFGGGKTLIEGGPDDDEPEGNVLSNVLDKNQDQYRDSVILFGPCGSGKSALYHQLVKNSTRVVPTVTSLKANVEILDGIRIVDYPGHVTLCAKLSTLLLPDSRGSNARGSIRGVLVVDSTKPITEVGTLLYNSILTNSSFVNAWNDANGDSDEIKIMVVCNKSDKSGSKNWRRIKIQLRTELDKLKKISSSVNTGNSDNIGGDSVNHSIDLSGKNIDLEDLSKNGVHNVKLSFMSLSCVNGKGMDELKTFISSGEVLTDNSSILKGPR